MTIQSIKFAPPNSLVAILDPDNRVEVPEWVRHAQYASTDTCILFACCAEVDGATELVMGNMHEVDPGIHPAFDGQLKTPNRKIALETVECDEILSATTARLETNVRIWTSQERYPDKVIVGID
jgi:hypothetical protein